MKDNKVVRLRRGAIALRQQFAQSCGGVFSDVFSEVEMAAVVSTHVESYRQRVYPPLDTLRLFVGQVLSADRACQDVVGRRLSERLAHGQTASTLNTGSYCDARARLPVAIPRTFGERIGNRLETAAPQNWRWQGRTVKLFDGTTVSMPDTPSNQHAFPQSREQKPGLGFPIARIGALIGLASGAILGYRVAACKGKGTGEQSLLRDLLDHHIAPGDILLADALLANWWIIERALAQGGDVVMTQHGSRRTDFTRGQPLGTNDHIVEWPRPPRPKLMSATEYVSYPERLLIREFEAGGRVMVTTLLDPKAAPTKALDRLYAMRWHIEVDLRTIKATLQMDVLRCKTQAMVEKEIAVYLLAYNLVRWAMATAATLANVLPRVLSFTGAKRLLAMFADHLRLAVGKRISLMMGIVLANIAALKLPHRPDRIEPRAKKRRPKPLPLLSVSRYVAREEIRVRRTLKLVA